MLIGLVPSLLHAKYNIRLFFSLIIVENLNSRKMYEVEFPSHFSTSSESFLNMIPGLFLSSFLFLPMLIYLCGVLVFLPILIYLCGVCIHISVQMYIYITEKSGSILLCNITFPTQTFSTSCAHIYQPNYFSLEQLHSSTQYRNSIIWKLGPKNHALVDWTLRFSLFSAVINCAKYMCVLYYSSCVLARCCDVNCPDVEFQKGRQMFSMRHSLWDSSESMLGSVRCAASAWPPRCLWKLTVEGPLLCGGGQRLGLHSTGKYPTAPEAATVMPFFFDLWEAGVSP